MEEYASLSDSIARIRGMFPETPGLVIPQPPESEELGELKLRNYARYVVTMREGRTEAWNTPLAVFLEVSNRCNFRCVFCAAAGAMEGIEVGTDIMSRELMEQIGPFLPGLADLETQLAGEPLLNPHLVDLVVAGLAYKSSVSIFTNGSLLGAEWAARVVETGLPRITVSISSADPDTYARLYKGGRLSRLEANLMSLKEEKARQNRELPELAFKAIAMRSAFQGLPDLVRFAAKVGAADITLAPLLVYDGFEPEDMSYKPERDDPIIDEARSVAAEAGVSLFLDLFLRTQGALEGSDCLEALSTLVESQSARTPGEHAKGKLRLGRPCSQVFSTMLVQANGEVKTCCRATGETATLGDATKQSLEEIWNGPEYQRLRAQHLALEVPPMCAFCFAHGQLRGSFAPSGDEAVGCLIANGVEIVSYESFAAALDHLRATFAELDSLVACFAAGEMGEGDAGLAELLAALPPVMERVTSSTSEAVATSRNWPALEFTVASASDLMEELSRVLERVGALGETEQLGMARDYLISSASDLNLRAQRILDVSVRAFNSLLDQLSMDE